MLDEYKPSHNENRLSHEGDIRFARKDYYSRGPGNLKFLLKNRYEWMNRFINKGDFALEVGCGTGISKDFIRKDCTVMECTPKMDS